MHLCEIKKPVLSKNQSTGSPAKVKMIVLAMVPNRRENTEQLNQQGRMMLHTLEKNKTRNKNLPTKAQERVASYKQVTKNSSQ